MLLTVPPTHVGLGVEVVGESGNCVTDNLTATVLLVCEPWLGGGGGALGVTSVRVPGGSTIGGLLVGGVPTGLAALAAIGAGGIEVAGDTAAGRITAVARIVSGAARLAVVRGLNTLVRSVAGGLAIVGGDTTTAV